MSRYKFLREFDGKIETGTEEEVRRIISYCRRRLQTAEMKEHDKHWRKLLKRAEEWYDERFQEGGS